MLLYCTSVIIYPVSYGFEIIRDEWPHSKMTGITWLTSQKHWEQALRYVAYGNEPSVETSYSTAAIFATIPNWNKRSSSQ